jgi:DUF917 family protein
LPFRGHSAAYPLGHYFGDAIRNITGEIVTIDGSNNGVLTDGASEVNGAFEQGDLKTGGITGDSEDAYSLKFDASNVVPTADENRPQTAPVLYCIKF